MPIYEYKCKDCENHFEAMQKMTDDALTNCDKCGGKLEKQWSLSGFQLKGEGWYLTDYAKKGKDSATVAGSSDSGEPKSAGGASDSSTSEKPAEKTSTNESTKTETSASNETVSTVSKTE